MVQAYAQRECIGGNLAGFARWARRFKGREGAGCLCADEFSG